MRITVRSLTGASSLDTAKPVNEGKVEAADLDLEPDTTMQGLRTAVQAALGIPAAEQRLVYAGTQLEDRVTSAWRARRSGALAAALGLEQLPDGAWLTLEHHGIQKGSVLNVVRKVHAPQEDPSPAAAAALAEGRLDRTFGAAAAGAVPAAAPSAPPAAVPLLAGMAAGGNGGTGNGSALGAQLEALNDLELLVLLRLRRHGDQR
ncbi:unnamed protein product [Symbiodinium pilosum]|uniref:Ubiquitin-like domain-containing protein n=1 Tax=Symbiodinium pilosum TaxID=2952 RepID=A0A812R1E7_SYMPI|nr:unnamed protein product [Symbiodinium pilosum]